ncbi:hypothetical protein OBBRIDRAFT_631336 [Obba rivulosa]|uniref:Uncharacterized protein n=1 Tax=Obba rivulosa TaxID=1052685 RepID=A0A8E2DJ39_9APHY|nr:hypothetical protein OBBRIDRAFT_631336 [Obba rivulosa]
MSSEFLTQNANIELTERSRQASLQVGKIKHTIPRSLRHVVDVLRVPDPKKMPTMWRVRKACRRLCVWIPIIVQFYQILSVSVAWATL